jgi:Sulfotransferase domain
MNSTEAPWVTVVSGLPRSGTSMMMRMLEAGGLPLLTDGERAADEDNPNGYYELERVKQLKQDASWLAEGRGKAVKAVYLHLYDLPPEHRYRVIFMRRPLQEVVASQSVMLRRNGQHGGALGEDRVADVFRRQLEQLEAWLAAQPNFAVLDVPYPEVLRDPSRWAAEIARFLERGLDTEAMARTVDPALHRQRAAV